MKPVKINCDEVAIPLAVTIGGKEYPLKAIPVSFVRESAALPKDISTVGLYNHKLESLRALLGADEKEVEKWDSRSVNKLFESIIEAINPESAGGDGEVVNPTG